MCELHNKKQGILSKTALLLCLFLLSPFCSFAAEFGDNLRINGFYGLSLNTTDSEGIQLPTASKTPISLESGKLNTDYSVFGLQADYAITQNLSLTLQGIISKQSEDSYTPSLEWGYLTYDFGKDLAIRAGQFKIPFLQGMELHHVGFSRLWARPLSPGSGAGGFDDYRGVEAIKSTTFGDYNVRFQGSFGKAEHHQDAVDNDHIKLISTRIEKNDSWVRLALFHAQYDVSIKDGQATIKNNAKKLMASFETEQLYGNTILNLGYVYGDAEASPDDHLAYLSVGHRMGAFTPYFLYQYRLMEHEASEFRPQLTGPPPSGPPQQQPKDGNFEVNSYSVGFRYDLGATHSIKAEWEHKITTDNTNSAIGEFKNKANIYSIMFESVF